MKKAIILMLALGFAQTNLSIAQSTQDLASKNEVIEQKEQIELSTEEKARWENVRIILEESAQLRRMHPELCQQPEKKVSSIKRKIAKTAMILFLGLATLYGTDFALEFAVNNLNLPASFFQYYEFGTLASLVNEYLYQIPATEIQNKLNLMIDDIGPIIKPLQFAATINGIKNFADERGRSVRNLGTWIKDIITF